MQRVVRRELMDDPAVGRAELAENFSDIERANRHFGGIDPIDGVVRALQARRVLDVGCGSGDIARALIARARKRGRPLEIVALDASETVLSIARERSGVEPGLHFVHGDARRLPFGDGAFDIVSCNLALHHFEPDDAVRVLAELRRVATVTPVVSDLARSPLGYAAALVFARTLAKNRLTRNDAPLSVRRAYTGAEAAALARVAGWGQPQARRTPFFRFLLLDRR